MTRGICHLASSPPGPPTPTRRVLGRRARTPCREAAGPRRPLLRPAGDGRAASGGCSLLIPFPPARLRLREWLSQDLPCFRARALVLTRLRCTVCLQAAWLGASVLKTFTRHPAGSGCAARSCFCAPSTPCPASREPGGSLFLNEKFSEPSGASRKMLCSSVCAGWRWGWAGS